jgi:maltose alpha-D-glucosyltransferase / alpha-amylase
MSYDDPLWYKDAVIYQLHVRAFYDTVGDGVGDFRGLTAKLDYLRDLGVTAIWLLPFYPSPLKDDGYDIADYASINADYGTLDDFKEFLDAARERGLKVITELVINHTSDQHPWFQAARRAPPGSPERDFYVWSDTPNKYREARIIFKDFEPSNWTFDRVANAYYWHRFFSHQPDLNFDNPAVWNAIIPLLDFWMDMGVDGMRLDAVPYLYEREGTNCENLPETHAFLKALRKHSDEKYPGRMLLAEANQWPEEAVAYFGDGDECHMAFHFPVMPRLFMSIHREDRFPITDIMDQTPAIPDNCQWAMFLRNHDELTLEMVTDEERDYMYRVYARDARARINLGIRRRLAPLLGNDRRRIELMNALLFSLPGTPVIYYGDEIGMGDNIYLGDRNGVRTPMQWSADRNAGFSRANPQRLYLPIVIDPEYHYETINVEAQQSNPHSLYWWMKRLIGLRRRFKAFSRGKLEFLYPDNRKVLAFLRSYDDEHILVIANLSRFVQYVELDLTRFRGSAPVELFGGNPFPVIGSSPYVLTLGPHSFYWFSLSARDVQEVTGYGPQRTKTIPEISVRNTWEQVFTDHAQQLEAAIPGYIQASRWYGSWPRGVKTAKVREIFRLTTANPLSYLVATDVDYTTGEAGMYLLPLAFAAEPRGTDLVTDSPQDVLVRLHGAQEGVLYNALIDNSFCNSLVDLVASKVRIWGSGGGELIATQLPIFETLRAQEETGATGSTDTIQQTTSYVCDAGRFALRMVHRIEEGVNPAWDVGRLLTERTNFFNHAPLAGGLDYRRRRGEPATFALLHGFVRNEGEAWSFTFDSLSDFLERVITHAHIAGAPPNISTSFWTDEPPDEVEDLIGDYLPLVRVLGQRVAELHLAVAAEADNPDFAPEGFNALYQRSVYQSMRTLKMEVFYELRRRMSTLSEEGQSLAERVLAHDNDIMGRFRLMVDRRLQSNRIRVHGNLHLAQVLFTGKDFVLVDFEGQAGASLAERRTKRSAVKDLASMLRSFHYAALSTFYGFGRGASSPQNIVGDEDRAHFLPWMRFWYTWVNAGFLKGYFDTAGDAPFVPQPGEERQILFDAYMLDRGLRELAFEMQHRPLWAVVPLAGVLDVLHSPDASPLLPLEQESLDVVPSGEPPSPSPATA